MATGLESGLAGRIRAARRGTAGGQFLALLRQRREGRALPLRSTRAARAAPHSAPRIHGSDLARLPPRRASRTALRLPGLRTVRPQARPPFQPSQASARSVREGPGGVAALERRPLWLPGGPSLGRSLLRSPQQRPGDAQVPSRRYRLHLGGRPPAAATLARERDLRAARARLHHASPRRSRAPARDLRRPGHPGRDRPPAPPRRHRRGAAPHPGLSHRSPPGGARAHQLLGLQHPRLLRPGSALSVPADADRVQGLRAAPPRRGDRGDPGRGLQPHRRGKPSRAHPLLSRDRQRIVLSSGPG